MGLAVSNIKREISRLEGRQASLLKELFKDANSIDYKDIIERAMRGYIDLHNLDIDMTDTSSVSLSNDMHAINMLTTYLVNLNLNLERIEKAKDKLQLLMNVDDNYVSKDTPITHQQNPAA